MLNTLDFDTSNTKQSIASEGLCHPNLVLQRSTTEISPLPHEFLDPPLILYNLCFVHVLMCW